MTIESEPNLKLTRAQYGSYDTRDDEDYFVLGESYKFKCEISGNPEPDYLTWIACDESGNVCNDTKKLSKSVRNTHKKLYPIQSKHFLPQRNLILSFANLLEFIVSGGVVP